MSSPELSRDSLCLYLDLDLVEATLRYLTARFLTLPATVAWVLARGAAKSALPEAGQKEQDIVVGYEGGCRTVEIPGG